MNDDIIGFFFGSIYSSTDLLRRVVIDIDSCCRTFGLKRTLAIWGETEQTKMCLYGGLQLSISSNIYVLPCQIWLSTTFPVEAPVIYLVAQEGPTKIVKIHSNHPVVDCTGRCYSRGLCRWDPLKSLLKDAITELLQSLRKSGVSPLVVEELTKTEKDKIGDPLSDDDDCCVVCYGQRDTVMVPCGHFCLCSSCAANVLDCPMCRTKIKFRQKIIV